MALSMRLSIAIVPLFLGGLAGAQQPGPTLQEQTQAMKACSFLEGQWSGQGWISFGPDQRRTFHETESVQPKLDGLVLQVDGTGTNDAGKVVHAALGILSFDGETKHYNFRAYDGSGHSLDAAADCKDGTMTWSMGADPRKMRYTIMLNGKGQWHETGEISAGDDSWHPFFEMTLSKTVH